MAILGSLISGGFFGGAFFGHQVRSTLDADRKNRKKLTIYKPTGLPPYRENRKSVEQRVEETREIAREVVKEAEFVEVVPATPISQMSLREIDAEIGELLRKKLRKEDEEIMLLLLVAAAG